MKPRLVVIMAAIGISLLALLPAGCSNGAGTTSTPGTSTPPNRAITGQVTYAGNVKPAHQIIIVVMRKGEQAPAYSAVISKPGSYTINNVADAIYTAFAFMDLGDDMGSPQPNEPSGYYDANGDGKGEDIIMQDGKGLNGIDILLADPK
jgi:hypothetical protein